MINLGPLTNKLFPIYPFFMNTRKKTFWLIFIVGTFFFNFIFDNLFTFCLSCVAFISSLGLIWKWNQ